MKSKIIDILKTFSQKDIKRFKDFLESPFFNESENLLILYKALIEFYPGFESPYLNEDYFSLKLNSGQKYKSSSLRVMFHDLANAAERFLKQVNFEGRQFEPEDFLRDEFFKRNLLKYVDPNTIKSNELLDKIDERNGSYFLKRFYLMTDITNNFYLTKPRANAEIIDQNARILNERGKYLAYFFVIEMMHVYDNLLTIKKSYRFSEEINFVFELFRKIDFGKILDFLSSETDKKSYAISLKLYLHLYVTYQGDNEESKYFAYKKFLVSNLENLSKGDVTFHLGRLIRYCMLKRNQKENGEKFSHELFTIYKFILSKNLYKSVVYEYLPVELFKSILHLALEMKKFKWTLAFIKKFTTRIDPERRKNMYHYSIAKYFFHRNRFEDAMRNFHKIHLNHFMLKIELKNMMLMTYFELGLFENALTLIDAYKHFLSYDKMLSPETKKNNKDFVLIIEKMVNYKDNHNPMTKYLIKKSIDGEVIHREWLNEKFEDLDRSYVKSA